jgi:hypothetical protein
MLFVPNNYPPGTIDDQRMPRMAAERLPGFSSATLARARRKPSTCAMVRSRCASQRGSGTAQQTLDVFRDVIWNIYDGHGVESRRSSDGQFFA